jgi:hypothetical protein
MAPVIYGLCAAAASTAALLLFRGFTITKARQLLWSGLCFVGLALNNLTLVVDHLVGPAMDLSTVRLYPALAGMFLLLYGLIWERE